MKTYQDHINEVFIDKRIAEIKAMTDEVKRLFPSATPDNIERAQALAIHKLKENAAQSMNESILKDPLFLKCCELANTEPTRKQASKFKRGEGLAWQYVHEAAKQLL